MRYYPEVPAQRRRAIVGDLVVVGLIVAFALLGMKVNDVTDELASLGRGVKEAGTSVQDGFTDAGGIVSEVPIVGGPLDDAFSEVGEQTGGNTAELGQAGEDAVENLAQLLGWITFGLPTLLVLLWAVPRRIRRVRRMAAASRFLQQPATQRHRELLAMRAAFHLPYEALVPYTGDPIGALAEGRYEPLLEALFEDAGLRAPQAPAP